MVGMALASGGHNHAHSNGTASAVITSKVEWVIPGSHTHSDGSTHNQASHGMKVGNGVKLVSQLGDKVEFKWTSSIHDLRQMAGKSEFDACNFTKATVLVSPAKSGDYDFMAKSTGMYYFSCMVGTHCKSHQKLIVEVVARKMMCLSATEHRMASGMKMLNSAHTPDPCAKCVGKTYPCDPSLQTTTPTTSGAQSSELRVSLMTVVGAVGLLLSSVAAR
jgi:hypothetical protein